MEPDTIDIDEVVARLEVLAEALEAIKLSKNIPDDKLLIALGLLYVDLNVVTYN